ncbi:hypothetical protein D3C83_122990 [compost metagenome]
MPFVPTVPNPLTPINTAPLPFANPLPRLNLDPDEDECECDDEKREPNPSNVVAGVQPFMRRMSQNSLDNLLRGKPT